MLHCTYKDVKERGLEVVLDDLLLEILPNVLITGLINGEKNKTKS